jgi:tagaturonate reductase
MRNIPLLLRHYELKDTAPVHMATGFAGFLQYMKVTRKDGNKYYGERNGVEYEIKDDSATYFQEAWANNSPAKLAEQVMQNEELWGTDLSKLPGFLQAVQEQLQDFAIKGVLSSIAQLENKKVTA